MESPQKIISQVFSDLDDDEIEALVAAGDMQDYPPGFILCYEGEIEHTFYIVLDGVVDITIRMLDGTPRKVSQREPGEYFGEMALIEGKPRSATVTTRERTTVLEYSEEIFDRLLNDNPVIAITVLRSLTSYLRSSDQASIADLSRKNVELAKAYAELKAAQAEIVKKERMERELEIAAEVQQSMLPDVFPNVPNWEFAGRNVPARSVGGDLYDVIQIDDDHIGVLIADVSDKSVHAALFMAVTRALFLAEARGSLSPLETTLNVHHGILDVSSKDDMFVTTFYGVLNPKTGIMRYVRAGQDYPIVWRAASGEALELDARGRFLGMLRDIHLEEREIEFNPGDTLVLYSDGVTDMVDSEGNPYSMENLIALLRNNVGASAEELCNSIFTAVDEHRDGTDAFDDMTLLIARRQR